MLAPCNNLQGERAFREDRDIRPGIMLGAPDVNQLAPGAEPDIGRQAVFKPIRQGIPADEVEDGAVRRQVAHPCVDFIRGQAAQERFLALGNPAFVKVCESRNDPRARLYATMDAHNGFVADLSATTFAEHGQPLWPAGHNPAGDYISAAAPKTTKPT